MVKLKLTAFIRRRMFYLRTTELLQPRVKDYLILFLKGFSHNTGHGM
jgi:hypothetical protein